MSAGGLDGARMLARYNAWANRLIFDAVAALPEGEATKERGTLFKNMVYTLNHNHVIALIWRAHLEGREHGLWLSVCTMFLNSVPRSFVASPSGRAATASKISRLAHAL